MHGNANVVMVAFTGTAVAAFERGGRLCRSHTVHSLFGVPVDRRVHQGKYTFSNWCLEASERDLATLQHKLSTITTLIVDEVSMLSRYLLRWMAAAMRWARSCDSAFGGS